MNDIEAIKVLEELINAGRFSKIPSHLLPDNFYTALSPAIAALEAKSEAEVVCAYLENNRMSIARWDDGKWILVSTKNLTTALIEPTLADLAKKIGEMK